MDTKKKSFLYLERDCDKRASFTAELEKIPVSDHVYRDEAGVEDSLSYAYGWSERGVRCPGERLGHHTQRLGHHTQRLGHHTQRLGHHTQRISMAGAWCEGEVLAPLTFEGYCNSDSVEAWFEQQLCRVLRAGQVVILDNASFHAMPRLGELLEKVNCSLLPLPPYSPDLNKIEPLWNKIKLKIALDRRTYATFREKVDAAFM